MMNSRRWRWLVCALGVALLALNLPFVLEWWQARRLHLRTGFTVRQYEDASGETYNYVLFVPHHRPSGEKLPLILFLNGRGENGTDGVAQISNNFGVEVWNMQRTFPMICLAPQCRDNWSPGSPDALRAIALLDRIIDEYDVDPDRVYVTGVSTGGDGAWNIAAACPGKFAAIVPISAPGNIAQQSVCDALARDQLPIWSFYNNRDNEPGLVEATRRMRAQLLAAGLRALVKTTCLIL